MQNKKGFTLIELLIVIAIITILAAAAIVGINPARNFRNARNATRLNHMNAISGSVYSYAVEHGGAFPACVPAYVAPEDDGPATNSISVCTEYLVATYTSALPTPPLVGEDPPEEYVVEQTAQGGLKITSTAQEAVEDAIQLIQ